jgi:hypothetical protein
MDANSEFIIYNPWNEKANIFLNVGFFRGGNRIPEGPR